MGKKKTDLTQGNITLQLLQFGLPIVVSMILQNLYNVADSLVVGRFIGDHALAAVGSTTSVSQFVLLLMGGATTGMGVIVSQYYGAGKEEEKNVKRAICTSFYIILMLAVVLGILGVLFSRQLLRGLMGVPEDVLEDSVLYLRIIFWGAVPTALYNMAFGISKALGDSVVPMLVLVVTCILNIGMNILFVAGFSMGVAGVGYATVLATLISAVICILILWKKQTIIHPEKDTIAFDWMIARHMVKIGIPSALVTATISIGNIITQRFINGYGATVMAAYSAANKIEMLLAYTPGGLTGAMQFFTGQNVGAGNYDRVKQGYRAMMKIGLAYTAIAMTVMIVFRTPLIDIFSKEGGDGPDWRTVSGCICHWTDFPEYYLYVKKYPDRSGRFHGACLCGTSGNGRKNYRWSGSCAVFRISWCVCRTANWLGTGHDLWSKPIYERFLDEKKTRKMKK